MDESGIPYIKNAPVLDGLDNESRFSGISAVFDGELLAQDSS
jgi:hypothetical protein